MSHETLTLYNIWAEMIWITFVNERLSKVGLLWEFGLGWVILFSITWRSSRRNMTEEHLMRWFSLSVRYYASFTPLREGRKPDRLVISDRVRLSAWSNSRTAAGIWMKVSKDFMPFECTPKRYLLTGRGRTQNSDGVGMCKGVRSGTAGKSGSIAENKPRVKQSPFGVVHLQTATGVGCPQ
jgi:hypothetical protein